MKFLCKLFPHKWSYYKRLEGDTRNLRFCKRCVKAQYLAGDGHIYRNEWITIVQRTLKGTQEELKKITELGTQADAQAKRRPTHRLVCRYGGKMTAKKRIEKALKLAEYGSYDGGHHKMWVIDQIVRALTGCKLDKTNTEFIKESEEYLKWVDNFKYGEDGPETYAWDTGIAP